ncbi:MAG: 50S ribosomal protein L33 [Candidatus Margulisbacteria bacterium]|nr:50S ribosomal protein L33 [Candidatus Margulisiibacteriota bacterium]
MRVLVTMVCQDCDRKNYSSNKNKKNTTEKLELKKYCKWCKKHTLHKEEK